MGSHEQRPIATHVVDRHGHINICDLLQLCRTLPDPEFDFGVPSTCDNQRLIVGRDNDTSNIFDGSVVLGYRNYLVGRGVKSLH